MFETDFRGIWVAGEIFGCRTAASGHYYFALKDDQSQLKCALFKGAARFARFKPQEGLAVIARGNLEVYQARGEYQLIVETLEPQGAGALQLAFEQLKKRLAAEGLFASERKRRLPQLPRRIGIVTSPSGAVIRDILHVLDRRFRGLHIRLFPAQVQGEGSIGQVCAGLQFFSDGGWAEVVILARGGGSLEDLWTFNEEAVARAIAGCKIPVISAIGHETDFTISDFVADHRAPTPSAAAEIVVRTSESLLEQVAGCRNKLQQAARYRLLLASRDLQQRGVERADRLVHRLLRSHSQQLDELESRLQRAEGNLMASYSQRLRECIRRFEVTNLRLRLVRSNNRNDQLTQRLAQAMEATLRKIRRQQETFTLHLSQLSPLTILGRGYAIVEKHSGHVVRSSAEVVPAEQLRVRLGKGGLNVAVSEITSVE